MMAKRSILIVDDDPAQARLLSFWLSKKDIECSIASSGEECLQQLSGLAPDAIFLDIGLPGISGLETLDVLHRRDPDLPVVMLTADGTTATIVDAMKRRAWDYLVKPLDAAQVVDTAERAIDRYQLALGLRGVRSVQEEAGLGGMIGTSAPMKRLYQQIERVATTDIAVVIGGESGTGKELVARALHDCGSRVDKPFIALNCAAVPESTQESELFGHERGAFTGASNRHEGRFEQADRGTLFLDEVAELTLALQAKLLRALQEQTFFRVGGSQEVRVDVRVVAATHRNLKEEVAQGRFRQDLYYRLAVYEVLVPPLRERGSDIALLATRFVEHYGQSLGRPKARLGAGAVDALVGYRWPGNVRELQNVIQRAILNADGSAIEACDLPHFVIHRSSEDAETPGNSDTAIPVMALDALEREAIGAAMRRHDGQINKVIAELDIPRTTLYRKLKAYGFR